MSVPFRGYYGCLLITTKKHYNMSYAATAFHLYARLTFNYRVNNVVRLFTSTGGSVHDTSMHVR